MSNGMNLISSEIWCLVLVFLIGGSYSLKALRISVPEKVKSGDSVTLLCEYDLENEPLYSIKWYWKQEEFYRYAPRDLPPQRNFHLPYVTVNISRSGPTQVTLTHVRQEQSGTYSCEVSTDAPSFYTGMKHATMVVEASSPKELRISVPRVVKTGATVTLSCDYDLKQESLFAVKWYWKGHEFYRYVPHVIPQHQYFELTHFKVDISLSGPTQVTLRDVHQDQSGRYTCEVSSEAPWFNVYRKNATMIVEESASRTLKISVPEAVKNGATVTLSCEYHLEPETLYALKWYWKQHEFYRYVPNESPQRKYFNLPHFKVDISHSGPTQVTLTDVRPEQTGNYTCEVTSDAPAFKTYKKNASMVVEESSSFGILRFSVPEVVKSGNTVTLSCDYDLKQEPLFSVKWFWKQQEFYRYDPKMVPSKMYFPLPHFKVDISRSSPSQVTLTDVRPEQTGSYTCEVTSDAPKFYTYQQNANMVIEESSTAKTLRILVPEVVKSGDTVTLSCDYDLKQPLFFVKWYWKQHEFYRYVPKMVPTKRSFPLPYFNVDISRSGQFQVTLTGVRKEQSGMYKCEVVSDAPFFDTVQRKSAMVIAELPSDDPVITVHPEEVEIGSKVEAECSVPGSHPLANLTWFLNDREITSNNDSVKILPIKLKTDGPQGLDSAKVKLEVITSRSLFLEGIMVVKCKATVFSLWNRTAEVSVAEYLAQNHSPTVTSVSPPHGRTKREESSADGSSSVKGLKGLRISVPEVVKSGDTVTLSCEYDLQQVPLYSINWYWKGQEFYRYVPKESPPQRAFHVAHFNIDISRSGPTQVTLKGIRRELSGRYECEVSCDAPWFYTGHKNATMIVAELSQDNPVLTVQPDRVEIGNKVQAECSAPGSDPPANLTWLINDEEITEDNESVKIFPRKLQTDTALGLHSSRTKLEVVTNRSHFINGIMVVKCEVTVFTLWNRSVESPVAEYIAQQFAPALDSVSSQQSQTKKEERDVVYHGSVDHASYSFDITMLVTLFNIICSR